MRVNKSVLWVFMIVRYVTLTDAEGISCFTCTVAPQPGVRKEFRQICSHFKENKHFQVFCPKSTLCMKKTIHHKLGNGTIVQTSVERGCAPQLDVFPVYNSKKRQWRDEEVVVSQAYEIGCFMGEDNGSPGGPAEYCYCNYHLCNGSQGLSGKIFIFSIIIPILLTFIQRLLNAMGVR